MKKVFTTMSILAIFFASTLSSFAATGDATTETATTTSTEQSSAFAIKTISVLSLNGIELTFSEALEDAEWAVREFKIVNKADPLDTYTVVDTMLNPKDKTKVLLALDKDTQKTKEYEVTVVAIKSASGNNIESGIDSTEAFVVADTTYPTIEDVINNYGNEAPVDLNAADVVSDSTNTGTNLAWTETATWSENLAVIATDSKNLPATGPETIIILMLSVILWFGAFVVKTKKS